jgi:hypothetical protein
MGGPSDQEGPEKGVPAKVLFQRALEVFQAQYAGLKAGPAEPGLYDETKRLCREVITLNARHARARQVGWVCVLVHVIGGKRL